MIKKYINKIFNKGYIRSSILSYATSILIIKKLNKDLRICVNYRALNALIILNRNIFLLIKKTLIKLYTARIYNKFNIITIFNEIRIRREYEYKTIFLTRYGLLEYVIIFFKLYNALVTF